MSYTELHIGKLSKIDLGGQSLEERLQTILALLGEEKIPDYCEDIVEYFKSEKSDKFIIVGGDLYQVLSKYNQESDGYISHGTRHSNGDIDYVLEFYNGGTYFSEMAEELVENLNKK